MSDIKTYKITLKQESKIISVPTSMQLFGYVFGKVMKEEQLNGTKISEYLENISNKTFNISSLMPKGYVVNPNIKYFIDNYVEDYTTEKSKLSKKVKKYEYIKSEFLNENLYEKENEIYLKIEKFKDEKEINENLKKFSTSVTQHVQINTSTDHKPNPFNNSSLNIKDETFEFYIQIDEEFEEVINKVFSNIQKNEIIVLGGQSSKGFNMFSLEKKEEVLINSSKYQLNLGYYLPKTLDEISKDINTEIKLKNIALRPVMKLPGASNETRYRTFYIPQGSILKLNNRDKYGSLIDYKDIDGDYKPKIFLKSFMYDLTIQNGGE